MTSATIAFVVITVLLAAGVVWSAIQTRRVVRRADQAAAHLAKANADLLIESARRDNAISRAHLGDRPFKLGDR